MMAMAWPMSTMASTTPGGAPRPAKPRRPALAVPDGRTLSTRSVMSSSVPRILSWYQEPGYPGINTTWHVADQPGRISEYERDDRQRSKRRQEPSRGRGRGRQGVRRAPDRARGVPARPPGADQPGRRRLSGLRPEELAQLAGVGVTWYTWLEQGRPINASVQVIEAIARTLKLDAIERAH